jgi:peptide deformylase
VSGETSSGAQMTNVYEHVVQIGDPVLRAVAKPLHRDDINSDVVRRVVDRLKEVMDKYDGCGMAAPQIGVPLQIFAIQYT